MQEWLEAEMQAEPDDKRHTFLEAVLQAVAAVFASGVLGTKLELDLASEDESKEQAETTP